jgi:DNA-binding IscR family transcriptional regulator
LSIVETKDKQSNFKSKLSNNIIKPLLNELNETCHKKLQQVTVEDIYNQIKKVAKKNKKESLDFVI